MSLLCMSLFVLKHAPYDAMVLVSNGYYVDQKLRACGGVWKVRLRLCIFVCHFICVNVHVEIII